MLLHVYSSLQLLGLPWCPVQNLPTDSWHSGEGGRDGYSDSILGQIHTGASLSQ